MADEGGQSKKAAERIIIPLDVSRVENAFDLIQMLAPFGVWFKLGLEAITASLNPADPIVWECIQLIKRLGGKVFLDPKLCDIPNTIARAAANVARLGVDAFNVHASAGSKAMEAAVVNRGEAQVWAVTLLTSLNAEDLDQLGFIQMPGGGLPDDGAPMPFAAFADTTYTDRLVMSMANRAAEAGCQGIICSAHELSILKGVNLTKVTPGIRPIWAAGDDQKRIMTPREAIMAGADLLVIGRPITNPPEGIDGPIEALSRVIKEIEQGFADCQTAEKGQGGGQ